jgi:uncharacterized membrane protein
MFDSVVDLHGQKKEHVWTYWLMASGAIAAMVVVALFHVYKRRNKLSKPSATTSISYETV